MCGITGIVDLRGNTRDLARHITAMTDALRHRGPDGEGFLFCNGADQVPAFGKDTPQSIIASSFSYAPKAEAGTVSDGNYQFVLGHRRLSVIDVTAAGHQPMCDPDKKVWITYNGEIYNYVELREELVKKGVVFRTGTDTEVILQSYLAWGEECVNRFNGMWALVIYDKSRNILFGSRDRTGVKPFYYFKNEGMFAFASEQKALLKLFGALGVSTGIRSGAAAAFLAGDIQYIERGEEGLFRSITEIMPAQNFRIDLATASFRKWNYYSWKANVSVSSFDEKKFQKYRDAAESLLVNSVRLRLRSDVPVGSCLSGGIDSSAIVGIMGKLISAGEKVNLGGKLNVFTLKFGQKEIDESRWAKYMVDRTGAEWNLVSPTAAELLRDLEELNYAQDIPVCSTGTYGQFQLMRRAKEKGIRVILDGQGGDELFGGYPSHSLVFWKELMRKGRYLTALAEMSGGGRFFTSQKQLLKDFLKKEFIAWAPFPIQRSVYKTYFRHYDFLNPAVIDKYVHSEIAAKEMAVTGSFTLNGALLSEFVNTRLKMYLKYEDRSSMWHSIEARTPFADDHLLSEYIFAVPGSYKIHNGVNKFLLREAMRNYLPAEIKERKDKLGFVTPIDQWVSQIKKECLDIFDDSVRDYIDVKKIKSDPDRFFRISTHAEAVRVFRMVSFAIWKKIFHL